MTTPRKVEPSEMHVGIFGPGRSGKTTLAKHLSRAAWMAGGVRSICWDINGEEWGKQALVFGDEFRFWKQVWHEKSCLVFVDEAAETIKRDDSKTSLFTRIRHRGHKLVVIGHSGVNLLPVQREQISTVYLFLQRPKGAELWVDLFVNERIREATTLRRYEFLECHLFGDVRRRVLKL